MDFSVSIARIKAFGENLRERYGKEEWFRGESLSMVFASVKERALQKKDEFNESILKKIEQFQPRLKNLESFIHRFPSLKSVNYKDELLMLKERLQKKLKK